MIMTPPTQQHEASNRLSEHEHEPVEVESKRPTPRTTRRVVLFLTTVALIGTALVAAGVAPRSNRAAELVTDGNAVAEARRVVVVTTPTRDGAAYELRLPGSTAPLQATVLYARTSG